MLKFKFNYQYQTLAYQKAEDTWHQIAIEQQFIGGFGSHGFKLEPSWISFTPRKQSILVFCKQISTLNGITYYRKSLPKEAPIIFNFNEADQVEKVKGKWVKKSLTKCFFCQSTKPKPPATKWIKEDHYLGALKTEADYQKNYTGSVYYCSWKCLDQQFEKEQKEAWAKGDCASCKQPLVVINEQCQAKKHQAKAHYFPLGKFKKGGHYE